MAYETITYKCGHQVQEQMYGSHDARRRRAAAMGMSDCPACRAAGSTLTGSEKQVAWAEDIRAEMIPAARAMLAAWIAEGEKSAMPADLKERAFDAATAYIEAWASETSAKAWIDRRAALPTKADLFAAVRKVIA